MWTSPDRSRQLALTTAGALATAVLTAGMLWALSGVAEAFHGLQTFRTAGDDRVETAAEVAHEAHPDGATHALVARAGGFADALAAAPLTRNPAAPH